jgi:hypothetical protein
MNKYDEILELFSQLTEADMPTCVRVRKPQTLEELYFLVDTFGRDQILKNWPDAEQYLEEEKTT